MKVSIKFLGTGTVMGVPIWNCECDVCKSTDKKDKRYRSSILVKINDKNIIIDFGQDFRNQLIKNNIKRIDYAFLTHSHRDHCGGVENLATAKNVIFTTPKDVLEEFNQLQGSSKDWLKTRNNTITIKEFEHFSIDDINIDTIKLEHKKDWGANVPCYGYIFSNKNFKFAYMSDFNKILEIEKLKDCDLIISDANGLDNIGHGHVGINGSIQIYNILKPKKMILTHLTHAMSHKNIVEYVKKYGNIYVAYDGMELEL